MRKFRWTIFVLLLVGVAGLGYKLRADWVGFRTQNAPEAIKPRPVPPLQTPAAAATAPDYAVVAQQNPFHPERNDAVPPPPTQAAAPNGPPPLIYGSMILGKEKFALMGTEQDPKPHKVMEGDSFNGYKLAQVMPQSVVLEANGSKNEVMLYNALSRLRRDYARTPPPPPPSAAQSATTVSANPASVPSGETAPAGKKVIQTPFGTMVVDK